MRTRHGATIPRIGAPPQVGSPVLPVATGHVPALPCYNGSVRLPMRHPPPAEAAAPAFCAYLDALAEGLRGLSLHAAARHTAPRRSRGRFGTAVQWHLGLDAHDSGPAADWEGTIEIKLVTVHRTARGHVRCDKLKVCDAHLDPYARLSNVLFVFADRWTRVVVGHTWFRRAGAGHAVLAAAYDADPHFDRPDLFVEARGRPGRSAPAYYVSARFVAEHVGLPDVPAITVDDAELRAHLRTGRVDPLWTPIAPDEDEAVCPRCGGGVRRLGPAEALRAKGVAPAVHRMPLEGVCARYPHGVCDRSRLPEPVPGVFGVREQIESLSCTGPVLRVADRVVEPDDHEHPVFLSA
ncbi:MAG: hypothetical protein D6705_04550 [Deltaproteobacteria bacterium]|nr:MAG: hypothetical protein D6705_04550 [Deltaproteobacteria bacterium]